VIRDVLIGILIPFIGTSLGAGCVFFMKKEMKEKTQKILSGFAAGVMVAASIWSLLIPAIEDSASLGRLSFLPAFIGFWIGILFLLALDELTPHLHVLTRETEGPKNHLSSDVLMMLAVTLHNIPEGLAVGVVYAGFLYGHTVIQSVLLPRWLCQSVLRFRIFLKVPLFPCRCMDQQRKRVKRSCMV
jgi:ZIP family zinc transporter